jgi:hypothetical protein
LNITHKTANNLDKKIELFLQKTLKEEEERREKDVRKEKNNHFQISLRLCRTPPK